MKRRTGIPGVVGSWSMGSPDADMRGSIEVHVDDPMPGLVRPPERKAYCNHTGHDYWPRPCDACLIRSERALQKATS